MQLNFEQSDVDTHPYDRNSSLRLPEGRLNWYGKNSIRVQDRQLKDNQALLLSLNMVSDRISTEKQGSFLSSLPARTGDWLPPTG